MKKLFLVVILFAACQSAVAADDLINCKWENGESMSETTCDDQRYFHGSEEDRARINKKRDRIQDGVRQRAGGKKLIEKELTQQEKNIIMKAVAKKFKDPESARFKWVKANLFWGEGKSSYCGLVNAKNGYGAYVGYETFYVNVIFEKGKIKQVDEDIKDLCMATLYSDMSSAK